MMFGNRFVRIPALCLLSVLASCATAPQESVDAPRAVVSIPLDIGKLKIERSYDYPDPRLGTVYAYAGEFALTPDVYIYPNPFLELRPTADLRVQTLALEVERFKQEIERAVQRGHYDAATFHETTDVRQAWEYGTVAGKRVTLTIEKNGNPVLSHAYVFPVADLFVKIRISHYEYFGLADNMDWFADELMRGTRVAFYGEDGGPVLNVGVNGNVPEQRASGLEDTRVVTARGATIEKAIVETREGVVYYGEFDTKEPVTGTSDSGARPFGTRGAGAGRPHR
ncbi:MAG TPA: hypothetical protein VHG33_06155 [Woeseiaceae bacterium]|nr:hypothetical protein [Woeseiaceae bacterium]